MKVSTICFLIAENQIYLAPKKEGFGAGYFNGYGGKLHEAETLLEGAVRELREESTVIANQNALEKVAEIDYLERERHLFNCHIFFLSRWEGAPQETQEMGRPQLFPCDQLPLEHMWKGDVLWIPRVVEGERLRGIVRYKCEMVEVGDSDFKNL